MAVQSAPPPPELAGAHRERLIAAMASSIEQRGYRNTSVADVVRVARTSRRTFYEHFEDRDACFLALFEATTGEMMKTIAGSVQFDGHWEGQIEEAVGAYFASVATHPALFESFTHELPGLGRAGVERSRRAAERFADLLVELAEAARRGHPELHARPLPRDTAVIIVGGLRELVVSAFAQHRDVTDLRAGAAGAVKAIVRAAVLDPEPASSRAS